MAISKKRFSLVSAPLRGAVKNKLEALACYTAMFVDTLMISYKIPNVNFERSKLCLFIR